MTPDAANAPDEPEIFDSHLYDPAPPPPGRSGPRLSSFRNLSSRTPLRTKLITAVLALVFVALAAISVTSVTVLRNYLTGQYDGTVTSTYQFYVNHWPDDLSGATLNGLYQVRGLPNLYVAVELPGGQLTPQNLPPASGNGPTFPGQGVPAQPVPDVPSVSAWAAANKGKLVTVGSKSGPDSWRVMATPVTVPTSNDSKVSGTLIVAWHLGDIDAEVRQLIVVDLAVSVAILIVLAAATIAVVRANLRPLDDIELTAGQIAAGHLNHRIPERDERTEIGSLGRSLNAMLGQIETAFHAREESEEAARRSEERMRRFIADASHELRTPLTTLRGFAEFYRQRGGVGLGGGTAPNGMTTQELDRLMHRLESEAARMGLLVEDLLQLARLDQQRPLDKGLVDLLSLAADAVQDARIVDQGRTIDLTVAPGAAFLVEGDEARLRQVIGNLVTNARVHTPKEAAITVAIASGTLESGTPAVVLDVIDDGPGMTAEQARHVFERFYRADQARGRTSGGTGLGLAIVAGLVQAHGGEVSVHTAPGRGADFRVKLPLSPDAVTADDDSGADESGDGDFGSLPYDFS
jgi:two-component system, OmpR family, sensor kinase